MNDILRRVKGFFFMDYLSCHFVDIVSGKEVNLYRDMDGRVWMSNSSWRWGFKVESNQV